MITNFTKGYIRYYIWTSNKYIFYIHDLDGNKNYTLYKLDIKNSKSEVLIASKNLRIVKIDYNRDFPDEIIITMYKDNSTIYDLYHIDINSDKITLIEKNPGNIFDWLLDSNRNITGKLTINEKGETELTIKKHENGKWEKITRWDMEASLLSTPIRYSKNNNYIYMLDSSNSNTSQIVKLEIDTGKINIIAQNKEYDINPLRINTYIDKLYPILFNHENWEIQAVCIDKFRKEWLILDESIKEDFNSIKKLDNRDFSIVSNDKSNEKWLVKYEGDKNPGTYYIFNRKTRKGTFLFHERPCLNNYILAEMEELIFTSRDGLTIHGYITYPPGSTKSELPMVILVHGGPWFRDSWGYKPIVQWLANRGYACMQINYRGSTGYGKEFLNAGNKEWGGKMQDDLIDGVKWAIKKGIADPKRIAIYGSGYGGYAAIAGATFTPDLFCCAVAIGCPGDLISCIQSFKGQWKGTLKRLTERIGDPDKDRELLMERSPFYKLEQIKIPLLIAYGLKSNNVKPSEPYKIVSTLKGKGIAVEHIVFPDEGNEIIQKKNRSKFYTISEKFLAKHLKGRYEDGKINLKEIYISNSRDNNTINDKAIIDKIIKDGDKYAFEKLMTHYEKPLLKHLFNMTGDFKVSMELLQETFFRVWMYIDTYTVFDGISFSSWLFKVASNVANKYKTTNSKLNKEINFSQMDIHITDEEWEEKIEDKIFTQSMIKSLKDPYKTSLILRYMEELDYKEIASIMNTKPHQIKNYLFRAKKAILKSSWNSEEKI